MQGINKKEVISFRKMIPAGQTDVIAERVKAQATIEEVRVRFYSGQQQTLRVRPIIEHKGNVIEDLITYPKTADTYLAGDDDYLTFPVSFSAENDDFVKVMVENKSTYDYTLVCDIVIDYYGGTNRVIGGLING